MQTLKWMFLLNAGAIAIVLTYVGSIVGKGQALTVTAAALLNGIRPFVLGCICVALAGATGFFNFSLVERAQPSTGQLHVFSDPRSKGWPMAKTQKSNETPEAFHKRFSRLIEGTRMAAIALACGSAVFFRWGAYQVLQAANSAAGYWLPY